MARGLWEKVFGEDAPLRARAAQGTALALEKFVGKLNQASNSITQYGDKVAQEAERVRLERLAQEAQKAQALEEKKLIQEERWQNRQLSEAAMADLKREGVPFTQRLGVRLRARFAGPVKDHRAHYERFQELRGEYLKDQENWLENRIAPHIQAEPTITEEKTEPTEAAKVAAANNFAEQAVPEFIPPDSFLSSLQGAGMLAHENNDDQDLEAELERMLAQRNADEAQGALQDVTEAPTPLVTPVAEKLSEAPIAESPEIAETISEEAPISLVPEADSEEPIAPEAPEITPLITEMAEPVAEQLPAEPIAPEATPLITEMAEPVAEQLPAETTPLITEIAEPVAEQAPEEPVVAKAHAAKDLAQSKAQKEATPLVEAAISPQKDLSDPIEPSALAAESAQDKAAKAPDAKKKASKKAPAKKTAAKEAIKPAVAKEVVAGNEESVNSDQVKSPAKKAAPKKAVAKAKKPTTKKSAPKKATVKAKETKKATVRPKPAAAEKTPKVVAKKETATKPALAKAAPAAEKAPKVVAKKEAATKPTLAKTAKKAAPAAKKESVRVAEKTEKTAPKAATPAKKGSAAPKPTQAQLDAWSKAGMEEKDVNYAASLVHRTKVLAKSVKPKKTPDMDDPQLLKKIIVSERRLASYLTEYGSRIGKKIEVETSMTKDGNFLYKSKSGLPLGRVDTKGELRILIGEEMSHLAKSTL